MFQTYTGNPKNLPCNIKIKNNPNEIIYNCFPKDDKFLELQGEMRTFLKNEVLSVEFITWVKSEILALEEEKKQIGFKPKKKKGKK